MMKEGNGNATINTRNLGHPFGTNVIATYKLNGKEVTEKVIAGGDRLESITLPPG